MDPRALTNPLVAGEFGLRFYAAAPIITHDGYRLGTVNVIGKEPREVSETELRTLTALAAVVADELELRLAARRTVQLEHELRELAVDQKVHAESVARMLQQTLFPRQLPPVPRIDLAAWYRSAEEGVDVGGDFYDVFEAGEGAWALVVGDICGKGVGAAAMMGIVRHSVRALTQANSTPSRVLARLNALRLGGDLDGRFCTVCYALVRPQEDRVVLTLSSAGHPLPLVSHPDGSVEQLGEWGQILGAFPDPHLKDFEFELGPGDVLLLYTDGLVEQPGFDLAIGQQRLEVALSYCRGQDASSIASFIEKGTLVSRARFRDDMAMLVARVLPGPDL